MPKKAAQAEADPHHDAENIRTVLDAMQIALGRGGASFLAGRLGMTLSAFGKRMKRPGAGLDHMTMKAMALVLTQRAPETAEPALSTIDVGDYLIEIRPSETGEPLPFWRKKE